MTNDTQKLDFLHGNIYFLKIYLRMKKIIVTL